ncbi:MAG: hypothetical protein ACE5HS_08235 [bacterium]
MLKSVFYSLCTHFSIGLIFSVLFISLNEIGKLYFRVTTILALILITLALLAQPFENQTVVGLLHFQDFFAHSAQKATVLFFTLSIVLIVIYNIVHPKWHKVFLLSILACGLAGLVNYAASYYQMSTSQAVEPVLFITNDVSSALILGSVLASMITGHWYLVQHNLNINALNRSSVIFVFSVLFRLVVMVFSMLFYWKFGSQTNVFEYIANLNLTGYLLIGRFVIGLFVPLVFAIMVWKAAKIHSTQSATGILYATIVLILIGEAFAKFLYYATGIPL